MAGQPAKGVLMLIAMLSQLLCVCRRDSRGGAIFKLLSLTHYRVTLLIFLSTYSFK